MSTDLLSSLLNLPLQRKGPLPLHEQLRSAIEMAIVSGDLPDGAALPSVRELAQALHLAPNTVIRAYRDLEAEHAVRAVPKRGFFVVGAADGQTASPTVEVQELVDQALNAARRSRLSRSEFLQLVIERLSKHTMTRHVAIVGHRDAALPDRVAATTAALADLPVEVIGLSFEELECAEPSALEQLARVEYFLVPVLETDQAARLLGRHGDRILPMTRTLRDDVHEFIVGQPEQARFGLAATTHELLGRMLAALRRLHPLRVPPIAALVDDRPALERLFKKTDVLVIGSMARPRLRDHLPLPIPSVELVYVPDAATLRRLRARLTEDAARGVVSR